MNLKGCIYAKYTREKQQNLL